MLLPQFFHHAATTGAGRLFCGMWKVVNGEFVENQVRNVAQITPLIAFPHSAAEKCSISAHRKTTVRLHCTTDVQPMHSNVRRPAVPSFHILCGPFAKEEGSF